MHTVTRLLAPAALAGSLGLAALAAPTHAQAQDPVARVLVDIADVVFRGGDPYYRHGRYERNDRLIVERDRYGRPVYYRNAPQHHRGSPPRGVAHGYWRNGPGAQQRNARYNNRGESVKCNRNGKCKVEYYDPRYDRGNHNRRR